MIKKRMIMVLACLLVLSACSTTPEKDGEKDGAPPAESPTLAQQGPRVEELYNRAARLLDQGEYTKAAKEFDEVDRQYPYSQWAVRAQLMSGYAYYKKLKYNEAVLALDHFLELHPGHENAAYAWYLKALSYYEQITDVRRDQKMTSLALDNLGQVVRRFPGTKYAKDAALKIDLTKDHLAGKEMEIGRYYLDRYHYQAAINRFQKVVREYQTTTHVPEALHRLVESWLALGINAEAQKSAAILGHNYPESRWYKDTYALLNTQTAAAPPKDRSFWDSIF